MLFVVGSQKQKISIPSSNAPVWVKFSLFLLSLLYTGMLFSMSSYESGRS